MTFEFDYDDSGISLRLPRARSGFLARLLPARMRDLDHLTADDRRLALALADLRAAADELGEPVEIAGDRIRLSHRLAAGLDADLAHVLDLPPLTDLTLRTDAEGVIGSEGFRLRAQWLRMGQPRLPRRTGAILQTDAGPQRVPLWMLEALELAEGFLPSRDDARHWAALARFRKALEPGVEMAGDSRLARLSMTDFLQGLEVSLTDRLSITPDALGDDFDIVPFSTDGLAGADHVSEDQAELTGRDLRAFQAKVRERGALNAFHLGPGRFLVVDPAAAPALQVMAQMQRAPRDERRAFIRNPRSRITEAIEAGLQQDAAFSDLTPEAQEEMVEALAGPVFVETQEYSERVIGIETYRGNPLKDFNASGTTWLPESYPPELLARFDDMATPALQALRDTVSEAITQAAPSVAFEGHDLPADANTLTVLDTRLAARSASEDEEEPQDDIPDGPVILQTAANFEDLSWSAGLRARSTALATAVPHLVTTRLKDHQVESLNWQIAAWKAGLPGILNADEQGLGKTLQTISFLVWLNEHMQQGGPRRPILIVAPTSLLVNWEQEVERHVAVPRLGHLTRLYGSATTGRKIAGARGRDTESGESTLDLSEITRGIADGTGHLRWVLTTYTTLTNYQHSLARIPFAAAVFDEIQNIKNPGTLAAHAARAVNADFRIGLTGTPIENATVDLWAIMDQIVPGSLGSLREFRSRFGTPDEGNMSELHARVFHPQAALPALALRRIKDHVARDLPAKTRLVHPRLMPPGQAQRYDEAKVKLANGGPGAALKMLHHIRSISVHPGSDEPLSDAAFIAASGRLAATFDILRRIRDKRQRALVFIEHRQMQYRFVELAKAEFGLPRIDLINGETPIPQRQKIVNAFQSHLAEDRGFDLLVLGPKAAGTGLTLTAATHVIHLSRWWNPAVEEQCNDRVHRIGQSHPVTIHIPLAIHPRFREGSFDLLLQSLMHKKRRLASSALWPMGEAQSDLSDLQAQLQNAAPEQDGDPLVQAMRAAFARDGSGPSEPGPDGAWPYQ